jgi:hypothetical protein
MVAVVTATRVTSAPGLLRARGHSLIISGKFGNAVNCQPRVASGPTDDADCHNFDFLSLSPSAWSIISITLQSSTSCSFGVTTCTLSGVPRYNFLSVIFSSHSRLFRWSQLPNTSPPISLPNSRSPRYWNDSRWIVQQHETGCVIHCIPTIDWWDRMRSDWADKRINFPFPGSILFRGVPDIQHVPLQL